MRISTSKSHDQYLQSIASQMGATVPEALNFLLFKLKESNYNFGSQLPQQPAQFQNPYYDPNTLENRATAMSGLSFIPQSPAAIQEFEDLAEEIDPIIQKFINLGLVDQF